MTELQLHRGILHDTARNAPGQQYWYSGQDAFGAYFNSDVGPIWDWDGDGLANADPAPAPDPDPDETTGPPAGDGPDPDETTGPPADDGDGPDNPIVEPLDPPPPEMRIDGVIMDAMMMDAMMMDAMMMDAMMMNAMMMAAMTIDPPGEDNPGDDDGEDGDEAGSDSESTASELIIDGEDETGDDAFEDGIAEHIKEANTEPEDPNGLNRDYIPNPPVDPPDSEDEANPEPAPDLDETTGPPAGDGDGGEGGDGGDGEATGPNKAYKIDDAPGLESPEFALNFDNDSDDFDRDDPTPHVAISIEVKGKTALPNMKGEIEIRKEGDTYLIGLWLSDEDYGLHRPTGLPESFGQLLDLSQADINEIWGV